MKNQISDITEEDIQKAINYLKTSKGQEEATRENAIKLLQGMQITAHMIAHDKVNEENKVYKSFLMGASQITDKELLDLDIQIKPCDDPEDRKLIIPAKSIEDYKNLIRNKLDSGFWNDFVGEDLIYFIFKMPNGEIKEFVYDEEDRLKIAELCSQLNHDPIEKTSDLLNYLAENSFYTASINNFKKAHYENN